MADDAYIGAELDLFAEAIEWKRYVRALIRPFVSGSVLEVGAGIGGTTQILHDLTAGAWTCLEPDVRLLERLRAQLAPTLGDRLRTRVADLRAVGDERFDTILYMDVLEHIADDRGELRRAHAHLAPGGRVVVVSPAHPFLYSPFDAAVGHHRRYTRASLVAAGPPELDLVACFYADSVGLLASAMNRFLLRQSMPTRRQILTWDRVLVRGSRVLDRPLRHKLGKSVVGVWRRGA